MRKRGLNRPGALMIVNALILTVLFGTWPLFMAANSPNHSFGFMLAGQHALLYSLIGLVVAVLYLFGCIKYSISKGYSGWVGLWLGVGQFPGLIALLILPDLVERFAYSAEAEKQRAKVR